MGERIETAFLGLGNAIVAGCLIYGMMRGELVGSGYAVLASVSAFVAIGFAARLALLARFPLDASDPPTKGKGGGDGR